MNLIDKTCLRQNAEVVFHLYESICSQHVMEMQMDHKLIRKLTRRDPKVEAGSGKVLAVEGKLSRSSLIGKDPWGDTALPEPELGGTVRKEASSTGETDVQVAATPKTFSELQLEREREGGGGMNVDCGLCGLVVWC